MQGSTANWTEEALDGLGGSFASAAEAIGGVSDDRYSIAGATVALRFASPALRERLTPAFAHLAARSGAEASAPALTVYLWDAASTATEPPPRPAVPDDQAEGALYHFHEPPLRAAYQPGLETLSVFDSREGTAWHWVADASDQPYWDQACPIRQVLFWWLGSRNYLQVHGAAIGTPAGGALVVGKAGSGKSTVALASLDSELLYAGDDYVAVTLGASPRIQSLYSSAKIEPEHVRTLLPHLLPAVANRDRLDEEKAVIYVEEHFPERVTSGFPLRAVLVPKVRATRAKTRVVETSRAAAFAALAPSTILQLHTAGPDAFATMSRLVRRVPCFGLELGSDIPTIPQAVVDLLSGLPTSQ
ncbi:MAG: serine kinase [Gaiellaceae bacterium]